MKVKRTSVDPMYRQIADILRRRIAHLEGFSARFGQVVAASESLKRGLRKLPCEVTDIPNGTNIFRLGLETGLDHGVFQARLEAAGIILPAPEQGAYFLKMNESILAVSVDALVRHFTEAMDASRKAGHGQG